MAGRRDGSVVFVDISGFTKLSEKLAKMGKEGAEQITDAIEACFTDLLSVAYANGGSLIKFGGDALLLLFEEDDHVAQRLPLGGRGCGGPCATSAGSRCPAARVHLRMSVGVHTGTFHFFLVGELASELLVPARLDRDGRDGAHRRGGRDPA